MSVYQENGYKNRADYLVSLAEEYGLSIDVVRAHASLLGPNEDFDGLINALEDMADEGLEWEDDDGDDEDDYFSDVDD